MDRLATRPEVRVGHAEASKTPCFGPEGTAPTPSPASPGLQCLSEIKDSLVPASRGRQGKDVLGAEPRDERFSPPRGVACKRHADVLTLCMRPLRWRAEAGSAPAHIHHAETRVSRKGSRAMYWGIPRWPAPPDNSSHPSQMGMGTLKHEGLKEGLPAQGKVLNRF